MTNLCKSQGDSVPTGKGDALIRLSYLSIMVQYALHWLNEGLALGFHTDLTGMEEMYSM